jgi:Mono-functional DNA-alkylating methyl methanesulfonate N-term
MYPSAVWTVKKSTRDEQDKYIIVSSPTSTLVLAVGESVEEVQDSGFLGTTSTLVAVNVGEDGLLQVGLSFHLLSSSNSSFSFLLFFFVYKLHTGASK